jgi:NDP-sugar pyrophosphorylase family protein
MSTATSLIEPRSSAGFVGAVLAGGRGRRMGTLNWLPKVLLPIRGRPVLAHQLAQLRDLGVERVLVVVGYRKDLVLDYLETTGRIGKGVEVVEQRKQRGSGDALLALEGSVSGPCVVFLGDIVFLPNEHLRQLVEPILRGECAATIAVVEEPDPERLAKNFRVEVDGGDRVVRVVEKPTDGRPGLKGCGIYAFTPDIFRAARTTPRTEGVLGITETIQTLIDFGLPVRAARVCRWDTNLTRAEDIAACEDFLRGLEQR